MVTILAPVGTSESELAAVMSEIKITAAASNIDIIGGHTEITTAVTRIVVMSTALGKVKKGKLVATCGAKPGDSIILTKWAGLEGTAIIASEKEEELRKIIPEEELTEAKSYFDKLSVIPEGMIAAEFGASSMHDVTEGGILGAVWEVAEASGKGIEIYEDRIPVSDVTKKICKHYGINPLRLISSGCMLICSSDGEGLSGKLTEANISNAIIGTVREGKDKILLSNSTSIAIEGPDSDELYKVVG
jgi:hydrogenase maturation factor